MTELLEHAIERAKALPSHRQDEVGHMLLTMLEQDYSQLRLSESQVVELRHRLTGPIDLVPEAEMDAFFRKLAG